MKKGLFIAILSVISIVFLGALGVNLAFPRPDYAIFAHSNLPRSLVYAVIYAESGFQEKAKSQAGALGLMQLMPNTAQYIAEREGVVFERERLLEGEYNVYLGCKYLEYLLERFPEQETAICAYNAGEGVVREWLASREFSLDGATLLKIPYAETAEYVKKIKKIRKIYEFLCDKT